MDHHDEARKTLRENRSAYEQVEGMVAWFSTALK